MIVDCELLYQVNSQERDGSLIDTLKYQVFPC